MNNKYHTIRLTFSNGKTVSAAIPELFTADELENAEIRVTAIQITEAKELPDGYSYEVLDEHKLGEVENEKNTE